MTNSDSPRTPWARKAGPACELKRPSIHKYVDRAFATQFLADRLGIPKANLRNERDKIGKTIDRASHSSDLRQRSDGKFKFGDLMAWARSVRRYQLAVRDEPSIQVMAMSSSPPGTRFGTPSARSLPPTITECHSVITQLQHKLHALTCKGRDDATEIDELKRQLAVKRGRQQAASAYGKAGGGRPRKIVSRL